MADRKDTVGAKLRAAREGARLSVRMLGLRSGIAYSSINRYEMGHRIPSLPTLRRLAKALGYRMSELVE